MWRKRIVLNASTRAMSIEMIPAWIHNRCSSRKIRLASSIDTGEKALNDDPTSHLSPHPSHQRMENPSPNPCSKRKRRCSKNRRSRGVIATYQGLNKSTREKEERRNQCWWQAKDREASSTYTMGAMGKMPGTMKASRLTVRRARTKRVAIKNVACIVELKTWWNDKRKFDSENRRRSTYGRIELNENENEKMNRSDVKIEKKWWRFYRSTLVNLDRWNADDDDRSIDRSVTNKENDRRSLSWIERKTNRERRKDKRKEKKTKWSNQITWIHLGF